MTVSWFETAAAKIRPTTIGQKLFAVLIIGVGLVFTINASVETITDSDRSTELTTGAARKLTELMAIHASQAEQLGEGEALYTAFSLDVEPDPRFRLVSIELIDSAGNSLDSFTVPSMRLPSGTLLRKLALDAARTERVQETRVSDVYFVAVPIRRPPPVSRTVGALALGWDVSHMAGDIRRQAIINGVIGVTASVGVIFLVIVLLRRLVLRPVAELTEHVLKIARTDDLSREMPASLTRQRDEIGILAHEFDTLVRRVVETKERALEQSYYGGMAEMAAGVLHNIRNALSPITIALWELKELTNGGVGGNFERAVAELQDPATIPDRRVKLLAFVKGAVAKLLQQQRVAGDQITTIVGHHRHIEQILQDHTLFARGSRRLAPVDLRPLVEEAGALVRSDRAPAIRVEIDASVASLPTVKGDPLVLGQVLSNLFVNATDSIRDAGREIGTITVRGEIETLDGHAAVHLMISDNGMGMSAETVGALFKRGFSTKKGKTGGVGLHWCANSVAAMNSRIFAESAGVGSGASFHLVLPVALEMKGVA
jgi:signal transduction histidine kinase